MYHHTHDIQLLSSNDKHFPLRLAHAQAGVTLLYYRGDSALLQQQRIVAIVGTRKPSMYGLSVVRDIVGQLVTANVVTVSGLAFGIDAAVHRETLALGGKTIAVLGSPIEDQEIHPQGQRQLAHEIVENGGLLLTEYPSGTAVQKSYFPIRNRIIAGCSDATIVVEAPLKSGALITARHALRYNRGVVSVPGSVYAPLSAGCNSIIRDGAVPLLSCDTVLDALGFAVGHSFSISHNEALEALSPLEQQILNFLEQRPLSVDEIIEAVPHAPSNVLSAITTLELKQLVRCIDAHTYTRTHIISCEYIPTTTQRPAESLPPQC